MISGLLKNKLARTLLVSIFIGLIVSGLFLVGFLGNLEVNFTDALYSPSNAFEDIIIIEIDDKSLQDLGRWQDWTRDYYAQVIDNLDQSYVIGMDIIFSESTSEDDILAGSIKNSNSNIVLAMEYTEFSFIDGELYGENLLKPNASIGEIGIDFQTGFVNIYEDGDGVIRSFIPYISGIENYEHFSMAIVREIKGDITPDLGNTKMLINYFAEPGGFERISFSDVYNNITDPSYFDGKIVLIGATASGLQDVHAVPISNQPMPGVEILANLIQSIINEDFLYQQNDIFAIGIILLFALAAGIILYRFRIHIATILLAAIAISYIFLSIFTFYSGIIMSILYPILTIVLVYIALIVIYYLTEERSRKWITSVFGKYVSPVVIANLINNPEMINLGGEKRNITIFFSDIRGFTSISEKLEPEELVHLLNEYLSEMTSIIIKDQGLVDKYMGDAIMAFWGAPLDHPIHAQQACSSSLEMIVKLKELQKKWKTEGIPSFDIGIGLNSGDAIVGNMGSKNRFDYTAMGDSVNLASRLEGLNKQYGTNIIISENTRKTVKDKFEMRKLDAVRVKGKKKPILIYELILKKGGLSTKQKEFIKLYEEGLELYFKKKWKLAINSFEKANKIKKGQASEMFINRCKEFIKNPPPEDWDGIWEMKTK